MDIENAVDMAVHLIRFKVEFEKYDRIFLKIGDCINLLTENGIIQEKYDSILNCSLSQDDIKSITDIGVSSSNKEVFNVIDIFNTSYKSYTELVNKSIDYIHDNQESFIEVSKSTDDEVLKLSYGFNKVLNVLNTRLGVKQ